MSRKKRKFETILTPAEKELQTFKYIDLQRACIVRGMDFNKLVEGDYHVLAGYFEKHYYDKPDNTRLDAFDEWREDLLRLRGDTDPYIKLGFIGEKDEEGEIISIKRLKKFKKPKKNKKRERDEKHNIWKGTKKALTYQCAEEGKSLEKTIKIVTAQFPDALEKSINIWLKRALRAIKEREK